MPVKLHHQNYIGGSWDHCICDVMSRADRQDAGTGMSLLTLRLNTKQKLKQVLYQRAEN